MSKLGSWSVTLKFAFTFHKFSPQISSGFLKGINHVIFTCLSLTLSNVLSNAHYTYILCHDVLSQWFIVYASIKIPLLNKILFEIVSLINFNHAFISHHSQINIFSGRKWVKWYTDTEATFLLQTMYLWNFHKTKKEKHPNLHSKLSSSLQRSVFLALILLIRKIKWFINPQVAWLKVWCNSYHKRLLFI